MITPSINFQRFLLDVPLRRIPSFDFDVIVAGTGCAGSAAALAASRHGATVGLVAKSDLQDTNTWHAKGGMAAVVGTGDSIGTHVEDTLAVGSGLSDPKIVDKVVRGGPSAVSLLESLGAAFDRNEDGSYELGREGGHSNPRIIHAHGASTGQEIQRVLGHATAADERIMSFENLFGVDIITDDQGRCRGMLCVNSDGNPVMIKARSVVLATGGAGQVYRETTNPEIATGDGVAMAWRSGAVIRDMEFVQFHPTCLYIAGAARVLISEVVRGAGAILVDHDGHRFMPELHPDAELAPRDVVSRAVMDRIIHSGRTNVFLDFSSVASNPHELFPGISRICNFFGIDIARDPVPIRPGAHYMVGGIEVDSEGRTCVPGLFAAGECASSGLHGANRMGSNSLLEGVVLGEHAGVAAAHHPRPEEWAIANQVMGVLGNVAPEQVSLNLTDFTYSLKSMMWRQVGLRRTTEDLRQAQDQLAFWARVMNGTMPTNPRAWELVNMLTVSSLIAKGAAARQESRGVHYNDDHPEAVSSWQTHVRQQALAADGLLQLGSPLTSVARAEDPVPGT
ncbi:MAG: L-aspartate oxidase [Phycisphaerales bacterium]|nr:L-aspartate oxidase [Phycisphaerales bacterium]